MVLQHSGYRGTGSDMASSFAKYGQRVSGPQVGAIAVMTRGRRGGHVGIITGIDASGNPIMISGNNGNRVRRSAGLARADLRLRHADALGRARRPPVLHGGGRKVRQGKVAHASKFAMMGVMVPEGTLPRSTDLQWSEHIMKRRTFLKGSAVAGATTLVAAPAIAQAAPEIKWRLTSSFPKSLETIYGTAQTFAKYVADATDNKFQIQTFAAGEIVPACRRLMP